MMPEMVIFRVCCSATTVCTYILSQYFISAGIAGLVTYSCLCQQTLHLFNRKKRRGSTGGLHNDRESVGILKYSMKKEVTEGGRLQMT